MARLRRWLLACAITGIAAPAFTGIAAPAFTGIVAPALAATEPLPAGESNPYVRHLAALINDYRARNGLGPLELAPELNSLASEHTMQMVANGRLSHDGFRDRFDRTQARLCVENVGRNFPHAEAQLDGWRASAGHHRNLLEPRVARMGIARHQAFVAFFACS